MVAEPAGAPVVNIQGLSKRYKKQTAVSDIDLTVHRGEIYGLIGPDGAGKSSLLKAIAGVLSFEQGRLEVFGINIDSEAAAERVKGRLGFMPQGLGLNLYADLSVEENIDFFAQLRQVTPQQLAERKQQLLRMTRLDKFRERMMKNLSGGMKQKLGLICTLIHQPELVILDEPTTGVDPVSRRDFWSILAELMREQNMTALISTAYMDEASRFQRLSLMHEGRVLATGEPEQIRQQAPGTVVEVSADPLGRALTPLRTHFPQNQMTGASLRLFVDQQTAAEAAATVSGYLSGVDIHSVRTSEPELEDSFIALLRQQNRIELAANGEFESEPETPASANDVVAIRANGLIRDFGAFRAVDQVSFTVRQGEIFALLGANGAGKTTTIKLLTGILPPSAGEGEVAGANMRLAGRAIKERIGYMSQSFSLYQDLTVLENLHLYAVIYGVPRNMIRQRIERLIRLAGLQSVTGLLVSSLPMGMRQRLALSCALVHRPRVLFLDEPTSGVDPIGRRRFWEILVHLAKVDQVAILVTTHYMSEAENCDRLALMYAGRVIADDTPARLKQELENEVGQLLDIVVDRPLQALQILDRAGFAGVSLFGQHIHLLTGDIENTVQQLHPLLEKHRIVLIRHTPLPITLEHVFVYRVLALEKQERQA